MSKNNHALDTEYKGGAISPPPNKVDLQYIQEILDTARSIGYIGIEDIPLLPKHPESFNPIPLCVPPVSQLLKSLAMKVLEGSGMAGEIQKRTEEVKKGIAKALEMSELAGQIGSGLSSDPIGSLDKIQKIADQYIPPGIKEGIETVKEVGNLIKEGKTIIDSLKSSDPIDNSGSTVMNLGKLPFLNFEALGIKEKKTNNKLEELLKNPEYVITKASIDRDTEESNSKIKDLEKKFDDIMTRFRENIENYPEAMTGQYFSSLSALDAARAKNQKNLDQLNSRYVKDFGREKMSYPDVPANWEARDR